MLNFAMVFVLLGGLAWGMFWDSVPGVPVKISWILSSIGLLLLMISLVTGRPAYRS